MRIYMVMSMIRELKLNSVEHKKFCEVMHSKLNEKGMSLKELADEMGVSVRSIYNFEKDTSRNPSKYLGAKIANYLGIRPSEYRKSTSGRSFFGCIAIALIPSSLRLTKLKLQMKYLLNQ